jgi:hypothetical protein
VENVVVVARDVDLLVLKYVVYDVVLDVET